MERKVTVILVAAAVLAALLWVAGLAGAGPLAKPNLQGGAPKMVSYQGQVPVRYTGKQPYDGEAYFKFAIVSRRGIVAPRTYWSNDGSSVGGAEPREGVVLLVTGGLFNVLLGDTSLPGMTQPLEASVFSGTERYLRVWFSTDGVTYEQLEPDQRIAAAPYALQAEEAFNAHALDGRLASDFADTTHTHDGLVPAGAMVLGRTDHETTLIAAGFSWTGQVLGDSWSTRAPMPTARTRLAAAVVDGVVYVVGGWSAVTEYETANEAYDPVTNSWTTRAPMPTGRNELAAAAVDGVIYAIGGEPEFSPAGVNEAYDPVTDSWTTRAPMPTVRYGEAAAAVDGTVYVIGSAARLVDEASNEAYDPVTNSWSTRAPMPTGRHFPAAAAVDGVIYAIGGYSSANNDYETANEAYDPVTDSWITRAPMRTGRDRMAWAVVDGVIYVFGGRSPVTTYETANEAYDPVTDSWRPMAPMRTGRFHPAAAVVGGTVYVIGGNLNGTILTDNEAYTPPLYVYRKD